MVNLYDSKETDFTRNGIVVLNECLQCNITEGLNDTLELLVEYPMTDMIKRAGVITPPVRVGQHKIGEIGIGSIAAKWKYLVEGNIIKADGQLFRIYHKTTDTSTNSITVNARHIYYDNADNYALACDLTNVIGSFAINYLTSHTQYPCPFTFSSDLINTGSYKSDPRNIVDTIMGTNGIIETYGGELVRDNFNVKLLEHRGSDKGVLIAYGKNLTSIKEEIDIDSVCTRGNFTATSLHGKKVILPEGYIDSPLIGNYAHPKIKDIAFTADQMPKADVVNMAVINATQTAQKESAAVDAGKLTTDWATPIASDAADEQRFTPAEKVSVKGLIDRAKVEKLAMDSKPDFYFQGKSGNYDSLDLLKEAIPDGNTNIYEVSISTQDIVTGEITVDTKWYFYNGTDWAETVIIGTQRQNYIDKYNALIDFISPLIANLTTTTKTNGPTVIERFNSYYTKKDILLGIIAQKAAEAVLNIQASENMKRDIIALRELSKAYFKSSDCDKPTTNYTFSLIELSNTIEYKDFKVLETVHLGDTITIKHAKYNMYLKNEVIKTVKDVLTQKLTSVEVGTPIPDIAVSLNNAVKGIKAQSIATSTVSSAVNKVGAGLSLVQILVNGNLTGDNLKPGTITGINIQSGSITGLQIEGASITGDLIVSGTITGDNIVANTITGDLITANTITANNIEAGTITADEIKARTITAGNIEVGTITAEEIHAGTITASLMVAKTITAESGILDDAVVGTAQIADLSITDGKVVSLTAEKITSGSIDTSKVTILSANGNMRIANDRMQFFDKSAIPKERVSIGNINGDDTLFGLRVRGVDGVTILMDETGVTHEGITDGAITNSKISTNADINGAKLLDDSISGGKLVIDSITAREIAAQSITANEILTGTITAASGIISSIDAGKITTGTLDAGNITVLNLEVGNNVTMGSKAVILWQNLTPETQANLKGADGSPGTPGTPGAKGADGSTTYTWVKYGTSSTGAGLNDSPIGMTYMGLAVNKTVITESTVPTDYTWSLIQGATGGLGAKGADGVTTYTWVKYGTSAAGAGLNDYPSGMTYMGFAYNKTTPTESNSPLDYAWSLIKGADAVLPSYIEPDKINSTRLTACTIESPSIIGGTITGAIINQTYGSTIVNSFKQNAYGGELNQYDNSGNLNVTLGVESGYGNNIGGTLTCFMDGSRAMSIMGAYKAKSAGFVSLWDANGKARVSIMGINDFDSSSISLRNSAGVEVTTLTETGGMIGTQPIVLVGSPLYMQSNMTVPVNSQVTFTHNLNHMPLYSIWGTNGACMLTVNMSAFSCWISNWGTKSWSGSMKLW